MLTLSKAFLQGHKTSRQLRVLTSRYSISTWRLLSSRAAVFCQEGKQGSALLTHYVGTLLAFGVATAVVHDTLTTTATKPTLLDARVPMAGDIIQTGTPIKEKSTGILFPQVCNGFDFTGCGVRVKWGLIKVYAVGTYMDRIAMNAVKKSPDRATLEKALLNPDYPRTIRIVMARDLTVQKFTSAIVEALKPRMNGEDLDKYVGFCCCCSCRRRWSEDYFL